MYITTGSLLQPLCFVVNQSSYNHLLLCASRGVTKGVQQHFFFCSTSQPGTDSILSPSQFDFA